MKNFFVTILLVVFSHALFAGSQGHHDHHDEKATESLAVDKLAIKQTLPGMPTTAGYFVLYNHSDKDVVINNVEGDVADRVELHDHVMKNGAMKMIEMDSIVIPANGSVEFQPGGKHIMFIGLNKPVQAGEEVNIVLTINDHHFLEVTLPAQTQEAVMKLFGNSNHGGHKGHHEHKHQHKHH